MLREGQFCVSGSNGQWLFCALLRRTMSLCSSTRHRTASLSSTGTLCSVHLVHNSCGQHSVCALQSRQTAESN